GDVHDERMVLGPPLQREYLRDSLRIRRVGAQAVHGLGRKGDELAVGEAAGSLHDARHQCASSQFAPTPASTTSGTSSFATPVMSASTALFTRSSSASGTSSTSSSCT